MQQPPSFDHAFTITDPQLISFKRERKRIQKNAGSLQERLLFTKEFIDRNLHMPLRLKDMAGTAFISEYHFVRLFKVSFDITPHQYHLKKRLAHAEQLLLNSSYTIEDIAYKCGFSNISTFSKAFKKHFVISPSQYKLNNSTNSISA